VAERSRAVDDLGVTTPTGTAFWRDRPTLVTGGSGLVGSWLVKRLLAAQADVVCLIRDWVPQSELMGSRVVEQVKAVRGELRDQRLLERLIGEYEIDTVLHLAAQTIVPIANRNPISTFETNVGGTWALLEACRRSPTVKQIVVASSDKSYGEQEQLPYEETMALAGRHPYDVSKSAGDLIAQSYAATYDLPVVITRCGNFYGGGDLNWSRIVPGTIRSVLRGKRPVIRSDGQSVRDYFYVEDGAAAYAFLAEHLAADRSLAGEAFNFSNEEPINVLDLTSKILALMGSDLKPDVRDEATNEIKCQYLSAAKAREKLGWRPLFQLEHGLLLTIDWYRDLLGGER
jgi:CDP-glucose 4,6-dehydratase